MANVLKAQLDFTGFVDLLNEDVTTVQKRAKLRIGASSLDTTFTQIQTIFNSATPTTAAPTSFYSTKQTILTTANFDIDLNGGTMDDDLGVAMVWTKLHALVVSVLTPNGTKYVKIGPQGATNALNFGFDGVASDDWVECYTVMPFIRPSANGWTVDATHKVVRINNPTGSSVIVEILAIGKP